MPSPSGRSVPLSPHDRTLLPSSAQASNYPDSSIQSAFNTALNNFSIPGSEVPTTTTVYARLLRMRTATAAFIDPMLLLRMEILPEVAGWLYELLDGYRALAIKTHSQASREHRHS